MKTKQPTLAQQQADRIRAYVLTHPHCTREQIETACDIQFNQWEDIKKHIKLVAHRGTHKNYTFTLAAEAM